MRSVSLVGCALLLLQGCGGDSEESGRGRGGAGGADTFGNAASEGGGGGSGFDNGGGTGASATPGAGGLPGGGGDDLMLDGSYIWIANSDEGTVSKIDTRTMEELGRYLTNPNGDGHPSRTSVGSTGAVVVANRGGGINFSSASGAGVTKIEATTELCSDRNGNGNIETSTGAGDILPWMQDECVSWWRPLAVYSNRPVTWAPAAGPDLPETVWTSGANDCVSSNCTITVYRLNGQTGDIEAQVDIGPLSGVAFTGGGVLDALFPGLGAVTDLPNYGAYGGASDGGGNFWGFVANTTHLFRVDALTLQWQVWEIPNANGYGITVDPKGRVFVCGQGGLSRFDPVTLSWQETPGNGGYIGCMTDGADSIWMGGGQLHQYDADSMALLGSYPVGGSVKGVSIDFDGLVWGVSQGSDAYRLDPATGQYETFNGLVGAYSYSDMTGFGLTRAGYVPVDPQ